MVVDRVRARRVVTRSSEPGHEYIARGTVLAFRFLAFLCTASFLVSLYFLVTWAPMLMAVAFLLNRFIFWGWEVLASRLVRLIALRDQGFLTVGLTTRLLSPEPARPSDRVTGLLAAAGLVLLSGLLGACQASPSSRRADDILAIVQAISWGMTQQAVQDRFPDKAFVPTVSQGLGDIAFITGYRDLVEGERAFVGFHFSGEDRLVRIAWSFDVSGGGASQAERLYTAYTDRFRRRFGVPLVEAAGGITTSRWKTAHGILIVGVTAASGFAIQAWNEPYFVTAAKTVR